ncbi:MAG TPA: hypothetical protein VKB51_06140 [bacterium]|nr:hypothetical protein [bacterium]
MAGSDETHARTVRKEMGINHADFFRILPRALNAIPYVVNGTEIVAEGEGMRLRIVLGEERERILGAVVRIPVTFVELRFEGYAAEEQAAFLEQFDRAYFKGGG